MSAIMLPAYIGGKDVEHPRGRYVHTVAVRAILEDTFAALSLKRALDEGRVDPEHGGAAVAGGCALADSDMIRDAVEAAAAAAPEWARVPLATRIELGVRIGERLRECRDRIVDLLVAEGQPRSLAGPCLDEYERADFSPETLAWCAEQMEFVRDTAGRRSIVRRVPDGVVCVNPPQNASTPNALFGVTALLAGNTAVIRAPRSVPLATTYALREVVVPVLEELGAPPGTLNIVCGPPMMDDWLASPDVDDIVYIGSSAKGLAFERAAVAAGKKPILELAGNDCVVVWRDADLTGAVHAITENFRQSGQICNIPNQVVAHPEIADELLDRLVRCAAGTKPGYPDEPGVVLTPVLMAGQFFADLTDAVAKGATLRHGGRRLEVDGSVSETGLFVEPTVLRVDGLELAATVDAVRNETFSPLVPVVVPEPAGSDDALLDRVLAFVAGNAYGLRNSFWTNDERVIDRVVGEVTGCGVVNVNDSHSAFRPFLPTHGGTGLTGGVFGEANYLMLRTSRLQGVNVVSAGAPTGGSR
ncbi:MAG TPA: aldehyde dehydrogenase [Actinophytocola sp.]|uniref:aldehyde dehydrogenase family protein n=1 Tax=Actinophytocola sp. TaxID=1872138 RepID=UPI002DDD443A|nr:aldehyde dehydrogenase [Actinophytocola sp.]HEV2783357.1 aldehyde dehydrogenase [Actinophytocola sp.]